MRTDRSQTRLHNNKNLGKFTCVGATGSSVVDYVTSNPDLLDYEEYFNVDDPNILSEHSMVEFTFFFYVPTCIPYTLQNETRYKHVNTKYLWNKDNTQLFKNRLHINCTRNK